MHLEPLTEDGPDGNLGGLTCAVCRRPGWLIDMTDDGFHIAHANSPLLCRASLDPPDAA